MVNLSQFFQAFSCSLRAWRDICIYWVVGTSDSAATSQFCKLLHQITDCITLNCLEQVGWSQKLNKIPTKQSKTKQNRKLKKKNNFWSRMIEFEQFHPDIVYAVYTLKDLIVDAFWLPDTRTHWTTWSYRTVLLMNVHESC